MGYKADGTWEPEDDNVAKGVEGVVAGNSPLMQQAETRGKQFANRRGLLNSTMGGQAAQAAVLDTALPIASQQSAQTHAKNVAGMDISAARDMQATDIAGKQDLLNTDIASKEHIATLNIAAHDREKATSAVAAMESVYSEMFKSIAGNKDLPQAARDSYQTHIGALRDSSLNMVEQLYGIDLEWPSAAGAA